ncbi:MDR family MFS transporter, partial [Myxococcus sp. 1LA]
MDAKRLPRAFWYIFAGTLINRLGTFIVPFLSLFLTEEAGLAPVSAGLVLSSRGMGFVVAGPVGGWLTDHVGRRATMLIGLVLSAVSLLALGLSRAFPALLLLAFAEGLSSGIPWPASSAMVADVVPAEARPRAYGLMYWGANMGTAFAMVLAGALAEQGFWALFVADAVTTLVFALLVWRMLPETRNADAPEEVAPGGLAADRSFLGFAFVMFIFAVLLGQSSTVLPLRMREMGLTSSDIGVALAVNGGLIALLQLKATRLLTGFPRVGTLAVGGLLAGVGFAMHGLDASLAAQVLAVGVWTLEEILTIPTAEWLTAEAAPPARRGAYQGAYMMAWSFALLAGPLLGTWLLERSGDSGLWMTYLGLERRSGYSEGAGKRQGS